jgi:membrane-associated progesterone receptor component
VRARARWCWARSARAQPFAVRRSPFAARAHPHRAAPAAAAAAAATTPGARMARTPPAELRDFTAEELKPFTGAGGRAIYVAADGVVFNMSSHEGGPGFYGPGGGYSGFAGRDATIGLATMETDPAKWLKATVGELSYAERDTLADWVQRFSAKYDIVGYLNDGARPRTVAGERAGKQQ